MGFEKVYNEGDKKKVHVNDLLSLNFLLLVGKVTVPLCFCVRVRQNSLEYLQILSDPFEKCWHSQDKSATPIN